MNRFQGAFPPVITIFDQSGNINIEAMKQHADFLIREGVAGLTYLGTSGEFSVMTQAQKLLLIREMVPYVKDRAKVFVGVGDTCLQNTLELISASSECGADAVLALVPYFNIYAENNVCAYFKAVAESTALPVILYNIPVLTGFNISPALVESLLQEHPNILGIKDTVEDENHLLSMLALKDKHPQFHVFCAYETQALRMLKMGVDGLINATANFAPRLSVDLIRAVQTGDESAVETKWHKLCCAAEVYSHSQPLLLAVKEAVYQTIPSIRGEEILPGLPLDEQQASAVSNILASL